MAYPDEENPENLPVPYESQPLMEYVAIGASTIDADPPDVDENNEDELNSQEEDAYREEETVFVSMGKVVDKHGNVHMFMGRRVAKYRVNEKPGVEPELVYDNQEKDTPLEMMMEMASGDPVIKRALRDFSEAFSPRLPFGTGDIFGCCRCLNESYPRLLDLEYAERHGGPGQVVSRAGVDLNGKDALSSPRQNVTKPLWGTMGKLLKLKTPEKQNQTTIIRYPDGTTVAVTLVRLPRGKTLDMLSEKEMAKLNEKHKAGIERYRKSQREVSRNPEQEENIAVVRSEIDR